MDAHYFGEFPAGFLQEMHGQILQALIDFTPKPPKAPEKPNSHLSVMDSINARQAASRRRG